MKPSDHPGEAKLYLMPRVLESRVHAIALSVRIEHHRVQSNTMHQYYYLRSIRIGEWLAYPPKLTVELGSYVDGEAHGWAR